MRLTIGKKLLGSFLIIAFILAGTSIFSSISINKIGEAFREVTERRIVLLTAAKDIEQNRALINNRLRDYLLTNQQSSLEEVGRHVNDLSNIINDTLKIPRAQESIDQLNKMNELTSIFSEAITPYLTSSKKLTLEIADTQLLPHTNEIKDIAALLANEQQVKMDQISAENIKMINSFEIIVIIVSIAAFIFAIVIGSIISRLISKSIVKITDVAERIAEGDLTSDHIHVKSRDELGQLANSFNHMVHNLRTLIEEVRSSAEQLAASSEELNASAEQTSSATEHIATSIQQVASGTDQQVQSVEETSQGIDEMSKGVHQIAVNAQGAYATSANSSEQATNGNRIITSAVEQMNLIQTSIEGLSKVISGLGVQSDQIGQIVNVISDIAAQTNLLALNAAIEAARAGDQGRGFAVVADEVRKLAEQSSHSTEQISQLIGAIQGETNTALQSMESATKEVSEGIHLVRSAGEMFGGIQLSISEVSSQIGDVSASVQQISAATEQMVESIHLIGEVAETSAANTQNVSSATEEQLASMEEISASANSLSKMAEDLQLLISKFKV